MISGFSGRFVASSLLVSTVLVAGCRDSAQTAVPPPSSASAVPSVVSSANEVPAPPVARVFAPSRPGCETVKVFAAGAPAGSVCVEDAEKNELTIVDLSDTWTPRVFAPDPITHDAPEYRAKYLELATSPNADLGLYGIAPTVSLLLERMSDVKRLACNEALDLSPVAEVAQTWANAPDDKARAATLKRAESGEALKTIQSELACSGFLKPAAANGIMTAQTRNALDAMRRRNMLVGASLDGETLAALALGGDELDFRAALRALRERVADAAGLVEDGSASETTELVMSRNLDLSRFAPATRGALENGAPDVVDIATDAAARALGWTSPDAARAFFSVQGKSAIKSMRVAVKLPPRPSYYSAAMDLRVEIDRGDVFYETPGAAALAKKKMGVFHGPSFVLYAKDGDHDVALMRWATTIGGWKKERTEDGEIVVKYKESDVGDRVWRQVIAAPAWLPPDSTPETDLLHEGKDGTLALKKSVIEPGYQNAYGLVMIIHDEPLTSASGKTTWADHGIRTHGSVDYRSIQRGESHGCHRLYNQLALRMSGFLLQHRTNVRRGKMASGYKRTLDYNEQTVDFEVPTRGYLYELDPPVPVRVLEGHIAGEAQKPMSSVIHIKTDDTKKG